MRILFAFKVFSFAMLACGGLITSFAAPAHASDPSVVTVYAAGDIADCRKVSAEKSGAAVTADLVASRLGADAQAVVMTLGDHTYPVGLLKEFTECYAPTWGRFKDRTHPTPGNHEYYTPLAGGYYAYFGDAAGPARRGYYAFRLGNWHVISLNSFLKPQQHQEQIDWLKRELETNKVRCTLAFWHHPRFSSGGHGDNPHMQDAWALLQEAGAELVLSAHDHVYERFAPQNAHGKRDERRGMRQFVVGTGGASLSRLGSASANSEVQHNLTHGVLKLVLQADGYEWEFLPITPGDFTDQGNAQCSK